MARYIRLLRFPVFLLVALVLGLLVEKTPGIMTVQLPDNSGSIAVPDSLEGWKITPGEGDVLLTGSTRFNLQSMELVRTHVPADSAALKIYIKERHDQLWKETDEYQWRLHGEVRRFAGSVPVPTGLGVHKAPLLGRFGDTAYWIHDLYFPHEGQWTRLTMSYPELLQRYVSVDHMIIGPHVRLNP